MKRCISLIVLSWFCYSLSAQHEVVNAGFEYWQDNQPVSWTASLAGNILVTIPVLGEQAVPISIDFGVRSTDAHSGNYALKLQAKKLGMPGGSSGGLPNMQNGDMMCPGMAQLGNAGEFNIPMEALMDLLPDSGSFNMEDLSSNMEDLSSLSSLLNLISPGDSCSQTPVSIDMWIKYLPDGSDSMSVIAFTKKDGLSKGFAFYTTGETLSEYTQISVPFTNSLADCDTIAIMLISGGKNTSLATELYVDDITLNYNTVGITENVLSGTRVYPNPAADYIHFNTASQDSYDYRLSDLSGKVVAEGLQVRGTQSVPVSALASGIYMLNIRQQSQSVTKKVVVVK